MYCLLLCEFLLDISNPVNQTSILMIFRGCEGCRDTETRQQLWFNILKQEFTGASLR